MSTLIYAIPKIGKFKETESRIEATSGHRKGEIGSYCLMGMDFLFGRTERVLKIDTGNGYPYPECTLYH